MIPVTKPFLPPKEEFLSLIDGIWDRNHLTNNGPLVQELEKKLKNYLRVPNIHYVTNGTIAIQIAIKALGLKGEIITTPFSYVATTSSIVWENCVPVFADIDSDTFNISPQSIKQVITSKTTAILATHVYGNPCDVESIQQIADKYNLKVIYDAAHAFGVKYKNKSIFEYGDISTTSFHATKLYHTIEGGAIFCKSEKIAEKVSTLRNFGHTTPGNYSGVGVNGKNSEFHAAMGLVNLKHVTDILDRREEITNFYDNNLFRKGVFRPKITKASTTYNFAYYPILLDTEASLLRVKKALESKFIYPRRYFYPSLNELDYVEDLGNTPLSDSIAKRALCLPVFHGISDDELVLVVEEFNKAVKKESMTKSECV